MGIVYKEYPIRGIDVSHFDKVIDWQRVKEFPVHFATIRVGYGKTTDGRFIYNQEHAREKVHRAYYWYMDYYSPESSNPNEWGKSQAEYCWSLIKNDNDKGLVWLDIESGAPSYSPPIYTVWDKAQKIAKAFLKRIDELSGRKNGIYCALSMLVWFDSWFKDRPLWLAWYNEGQNLTTITKAITNRGWIGKLLLWQYASDGDTDDDGRGNGLEIGLGRKVGDLDLWMGTLEDWKQYSDNWEIIFDPVIPGEPLYTIQVTASGLNVRSGPGINHIVLYTVSRGTLLKIYEENKGWGRISVSKREWVTLNPEYSKKVEEDEIMEWRVTATNGLNIRKGPDSSLYPVIGVYKYNTVFSTKEVLSNGWGKLAYREGYVCLKYAVQI